MDPSTNTIAVPMGGRFANAPSASTRIPTKTRIGRSIPPTLHVMWHLPVMIYSLGAIRSHKDSSFESYDNHARRICGERCQARWQMRSNATAVTFRLGQDATDLKSTNAAVRNSRRSPCVEGIVRGWIADPPALQVETLCCLLNCKHDARSLDAQPIGYGERLHQ